MLDADPNRLGFFRVADEVQRLAKDDRGNEVPELMDLLREGMRHTGDNDEYEWEVDEKTGARVDGLARLINVGRYDTWNVATGPRWVATGPRCGGI